MNRMITLCVAGLALGASAVDAADDERGARLGLGSGALAGVVAGGPLGLVVGAGLGAFIGDLLQRSAELDEAGAALAAQQDELHHTRAALGDSRDELTRLAAALHDRDIRIAQIEQARTAGATPDLGRALSDGLKVDVLFRTGVSELPAQTGGRLAELARLLNTVPELAVRLDGHTDPRGDESYNAGLALARVDTVRRALLEAGVDPSRIESRAHGEARSAASEGDLDAYALERRVSITFTQQRELAQLTD